MATMVSLDNFLSNPLWSFLFELRLTGVNSVRINLHIIIAWLGTAKTFIGVFRTGGPTIGWRLASRIQIQSGLKHQAFQHLTQDHEALDEYA